MHACLEALSQGTNHGVVAFGDDGGFAEGPAEVGIAELGAAQALDLAGTGDGAFEQAAVGEEVFEWGGSSVASSTVEPAGQRRSLSSLATSSMNSPETNPELGNVVLEVVENQIRENDPPETRLTVDRLVGEGYSEDESRRLVSIAVSVEIFHIMRNHEKFNRDRYVGNLSRLPREPWDQDGKEFYRG